MPRYQAPQNVTIDARLPNDIRNHIVAHLDGVTLKELRLAVFRQADPLFSFATACLFSRLTCWNLLKAIDEGLPASYLQHVQALTHVLLTVTSEDDDQASTFRRRIINLLPSLSGLTYIHITVFAHSSYGVLPRLVPTWVNDLEILKQHLQTRPIVCDVLLEPMRGISGATDHSAHASDISYTDFRYLVLASLPKVRDVTITDCKEENNVAKSAWPSRLPVRELYLTSATTATLSALLRALKPRRLVLRGMFGGRCLLDCAAQTEFLNRVQCITEQAARLSFSNIYRLEGGLPSLHALDFQRLSDSDCISLLMQHMPLLHTFRNKLSSACIQALVDGLRDGKSPALQTVALHDVIDGPSRTQTLTLRSDAFRYLTESVEVTLQLLLSPLQSEDIAETIELVGDVAAPHIRDLKICLTTPSYVSWKDTLHLPRLTKLTLLMQADMDKDREAPTQEDKQILELLTHLHAPSLRKLDVEIIGEAVVVPIVDVLKAKIAGDDLIRLDELLLAITTESSEGADDVYEDALTDEDGSEDNEHTDVDDEEAENQDGNAGCNSVRDTQDAEAHRAALDASVQALRMTCQTLSIRFTYYGPVD